MYRKDVEEMCLNKLTTLISSDMEKNCSKSFSDASNSSGKNLLEPFDMEPHKAIPKKPFVSEEWKKKVTVNK